LLSGIQLDMQEQALFLPAFAEAYLQAGNLSRARQVLDAPLALPRLEMKGMLPDALRVHAKLLFATGDLAGAEAVLNDLIDQTRSMPYPFAEARAHGEYGLLEARRGHPQAARERFEEALAIYRRLGARPFVAQMEQALAPLTQECASRRHLD
jgi:tetratricopeptide (TPR) repeat protein